MDSKIGLTPSESIVPVLGNLYETYVRNKGGDYIESKVLTDPDKLKTDILKVLKARNGEIRANNLPKDTIVSELQTQFTNLLKLTVSQSITTTKLVRTKAIYAFRDVLQEYPDIYVWLFCNISAAFVNIKKLQETIAKSDDFPTTHCMLKSHAEGLELLCLSHGNRPIIINGSESNVRWDTGSSDSKSKPFALFNFARISNTTTQGSDAAAQESTAPNSLQNLGVWSDAFNAVVANLAHPSSLSISLVYLSHCPLPVGDDLYSRASVMLKACEALQSVFTNNYQFKDADGELPRAESRVKGYVERLIQFCQVIESEGPKVPSAVKQGLQDLQAKLNNVEGSQNLLQIQFDFSPILSALGDVHNCNASIV